jgi:hypothetical protein
VRLEAGKSARLVRRDDSCRQIALDLSGQSHPAFEVVPRQQPTDLNTNGCVRELFCRVL